MVRQHSRQYISPRPGEPTMIDRDVIRLAFPLLSHESPLSGDEQPGGEVKFRGEAKSFLLARWIDRDTIEITDLDGSSPRAVESMWYVRRTHGDAT